MEETLSFVKLNCLNCGAKLKITDRIFEFACQYCGATQLVERAGGVIALKFLSDKLDRVQTTVDKTAAEVKIQTLRSDLEELDERHDKLKTATDLMTNMINRIALPVVVVIPFVFVVLAASLTSAAWLVLGAVVEAAAIFLWRTKINGINSDFERVAKPMIARGVEIKKRIAELKTIAEY